MRKDMRGRKDTRGTKSTYYNGLLLFARKFYQALFLDVYSKDKSAVLFFMF